MESKHISLQLRQTRPNVVLVRASNDTVADEYGTIITIEALMRDWLPAFWQHRTISLQHNLPELRGIRGRAFIGRATRVDFTPQLEIEIEILDDETREMLAANRIAGASLEFVPIEERVQTINGQTSRVYYRLASEPELAGLTLTDLPAVPGADVLEMRSDVLAPWQFAVVDPAVFTAASLEAASRLMWFPHHDARTHAVDQAMLQRAIEDLRDNRYEISEGATLTREEVAARAIAHLNRHTTLGIGIRTEVTVEQNNQPQAPERSAQQVDLNINLDFRTPQEIAASEAQQTQTEPAPAQSEAAIEERVARAVAEAFAKMPEPALAAIADGSASLRSRRQSGDEVLSEILLRSVIPQIQRREPGATERQEIENILRRNGLDTRAITVEANGTVIYNELARQFAVRPEADIIARNHWPSVPMENTNKRTFPRFDRNGISHVWGRSSMSNIADGDPTLDTFEVEVQELNSKTTVPDSFSLFNAQGTSFIQQVLLPAMRGAAQYEEDRSFFLSDGVAPNPTKVIGLRHKTGVSVVLPSANGDAFSQNVLTSLLRAMPARYRGDVTRLAYYVAVPIADDYGDILAARQTPGGDVWLERFSAQPGPAPIGVHRGIPIYAVPHLPSNETQGTNNDCTTIYLVHRDIPVIGDALAIRIEPYRRENFIDVLQLQEFVGLGYQWPDAVVRRSGVRPA